MKVRLDRRTNIIWVRYNGFNIYKIIHFDLLLGKMAVIDETNTSLDRIIPARHTVFENVVNNK